jgi:hypothetical protein
VSLAESFSTTTTTAVSRLTRSVPTLPRPSLLSLTANSPTFAPVRCGFSSQSNNPQAQQEPIAAMMNGASPPPRSKRKQGPSSIQERPPKQRLVDLNGNSGKDSPGINTPDELDDDIDQVMTTSYLPTVSDTAEWQATVEKVIRNVVSIRFCQTCAFDTDSALTSEATGFVVDAERG